MIAGIDFAAAAWIILLAVAMHRASAMDAAAGGSIHEDVWITWYMLTIVLVFVLMLGSVSSLIAVRTMALKPLTFRVLLAGTMTLALVTTVIITLSRLGLSV